MAAIKIIEYFSVAVSEIAPTVDTSFYINKLSAAEGEQEELIEVLTWQCAADVLMVMGEKELAQKAIDKVNEFIALNTI